MRPTTYSDTAAVAIFQQLLNQLPGDDPKKLYSKIRRKLSRANLGPYDQRTVDEIRRLHDALQKEISRMQHSEYYRGTPGEFAAPEHFDTAAMVRDYARAFPSINEDDLSRIVGISVYFYYLR